MKRLLMIFPLALILCFMVGCQDEEAMAELEKFKAQAEIEKQNEALYRGTIEELNKGNSEYFNEFYSPDFLYCFPSNNPKPLSREKAQEFEKTFSKAFPDFNLSNETRLGLGGRAVLHIWQNQFQARKEPLPSGGDIQPPKITPQFTPGGDSLFIRLRPLYRLEARILADRPDKKKRKAPRKKKMRVSEESLEQFRRRLVDLNHNGREHNSTEEALRESEEKYRTVVNSANDGIIIVQDGLVQFINPRVSEMGGYSTEEVIGRPFTDFLSPEELPEIKQLYDLRMAGQNVPAKYELVLHKKNGDLFFVEVNTSVISYRNKPAALIIARDFTARKRTEKLKDSIFRISEAAISSESLEELFKSIHRVISNLMPAKNFYIALYDSISDILSFPYFVDEFDPTPEPKNPGRGLTEFVLRTGKPLLASPEVFAQLVQSGEVEPIGAPSIDWLGVPLNIEGNTIGVLVVQTYTEGVRYGEEEKNILKFVSDQVAMAVYRKRTEAQIKASLEEKDVLLKEIHHRVKNNMQVISSLLNLQSRRIQDPDVLEMFRESQRRIRSMALIHERLYQSSDLSRIEFSEYLHNLATHLFHSYQVDASRVRLHVEAEEVHLDINTAIPCGLIVNELVSNALKHAFPEERSGHLDLDLHKMNGDGYVLRVKDDGVGFPENLDFRRTETLGMQIVSTLVDQIDGRFALERGRGTCFTLEFHELPQKLRR